ncbi:MAG: hypothetical protein WKH64_14255 [Chloroflexia bacterium]
MVSESDEQYIDAIIAAGRDRTVSRSGERRRPEQPPTDSARAHSDAVSCSTGVRRRNARSLDATSRAAEPRRIGCAVGASGALGARIRYDTRRRKVWRSEMSVREAVRGAVEEQVRDVAAASLGEQSSGSVGGRVRGAVEELVARGRNQQFVIDPADFLSARELGEAISTR